MKSTAMRLFLVFSFVLLGLVFLAQSVSAATYYVGTSGSDSTSCGTARQVSTPRRTIQAGLACLAAGDTLLLRGGTYPEGIVAVSMPIPSGVTIGGAPGETATLPFITVGPGAGLHGVTFDNLTVDTSMTDGSVYFGDPSSDHLTLSNSEVKGKQCTNNGAGMVEGNSPYSTFRGNAIHDAGGGGQSFGWGCYGMYFNGHDALIEGNRFYNNAGYALSMYHQGDQTSNTNNIVRGNSFVRNCTSDGTRGLSLGAVILTSGPGIRFENNVVAQNTGAACAVAVALGSDGGVVTGNTICGNKAVGVQLSAGFGNMVISQNHVFGNGHDDVVDEGAPGATVSGNDGGAACPTDVLPRPRLPMPTNLRLITVP